MVRACQLYNKDKIRAAAATATATTVQNQRNPQFLCDLQIQNEIDESILCVD